MDTLQITWEGANGSSWSLLDPFSPVRLISMGGLGMPTFTSQFATTGARDGRRYEGTVWGHSALTVSVLVGDDYPAPGFRHRRVYDDWRALDRSWRKSLSAEKEGRLIVSSGVGVRSMRLRLAAPLEMPPRNSGEIGEAVYVMSMSADDHPWWEGEPVSVSVQFEDISKPFYGGPEDDYLFWISDSGVSERAEITNPGDRPAFPRWWARGAASSGLIGIDDKTIPLPFALAPGEEVYVDSDLQTITSGLGESRWADMGFADPTFAPIPAGEQVPVVAHLNDYGPKAEVGLEITPLYEGPW